MTPKLIYVLSVLAFIATFAFFYFTQPRDFPVSAGAGLLAVCCVLVFDTNGSRKP